MEAHLHSEPTPIELLILRGKIKDARKRAGLGQTEFAHACGVSQAKVSGWETGKTTPSILEWVRIAAVTGAEDLLDLRPLSVTVPATGRELTQLALPLDCLILPSRPLIDLTLEDDLALAR